MRGQYSLEVQALLELDGGSFMGWWSKGHHNPEEFHRAVVDYEEGVHSVPAVADVKHLWARVLPNRFTDEGGGWLSYCSGPGRGAFPLTELEAR